ncbi:MAG: hypothetical protein KatS3mg015_0703 [Fimbriimonadales bacterium]|nr:MAG: hypothetical protein KatS3mg015_0703 [Fimbriimonadales bacterium]
MPRTDPRVDQYIASAAEFAQPILTHLRELVHRACPEVEETMKWSFPHFEFKGVLCSMAAFKHHCAFGFWKASLMKDPKGILREGEAMGHLGKITSLDDLPPDRVLLAYIREAVELNEKGVKLPAKKSSASKPVRVPKDFQEALKANPKAQATFKSFPPSHKREYVEWIEEAKRDATRQRRIQTAIEWLAEGKSRNWKYERP